MGANTRESYERQLRLLGKAGEDIRNLNQELANALSDYRRSLDQAAEAGFMREYVEALVEKYEEFSHIVFGAQKRLAAHERHISHLREELVRLKRAAKG